MAGEDLSKNKEQTQSEYEIKKPISVFEEMVDIDQIAEILKTIPNEGEKDELLRLLEKHMPMTAEDPTNWELSDVTQKLCTIDMFLSTDLVEEYDGRFIAIAKTKVQEASMWLNRAYFQEKRKEKEAKKGLDD